MTALSADALGYGMEQNQGDGRVEGVEGVEVAYHLLE